MKNVDKLAQFIAKNGADGILLHTIPGTNYWVICEKVDADKWNLTMGNPMGEVLHSLGTVTNEQHIAIWMELVKIEIEAKAKELESAKEDRRKIINT